MLLNIVLIMAFFFLLQISSFAEIKSLKEDLSKKGSLLVKLKEDKMRKPGASESSPSRSSGDKEKDELKRTIKRLEDRLRSVNKAEKPLEEGDLEDQENNEKQVNLDHF
jgi:predicted Holliday junction resolvase-like endonuclease